MAHTSKIFGIGLSKTGTTSLYAALDQLGYRAGTYRHLKKLSLTAWFEGDFSRDYLAEYDALTDLPIGVFYDALDRRYPGSKFILTLRDAESWLDSAERQFTRDLNPPPGFTRDVRMATYGIHGFNRDRFRHVYETHTRNVRSYFADRPEDLLELDIRAGDRWDKLCPFLDREVPDEPFPHAYPGYRPEGENSTYRRLKNKLKNGLRGE